eukprot:8169744-Ditylum_brightwellii.AAC.1
MSFKAKDTPRCTPKIHYLKSPPYKKMFASPIPRLNSSSQYNSDFQSIGSNGGTHDFLQEYGIVNLEYFVLQNGTKENLHVTLVNAIYPERNGGMYGCDITFMQDIEFNNYSRNAIKIHLETSPYDFKSFKMAPQDLIGFVTKHLFEEVATESRKQIDKFTTRAIKHDALGIKQSSECNWSYHPFIWPIGAFLDNTIFSGNSET